MTDRTVSTTSPRRLLLPGASTQVGLLAIVGFLWVVFTALAPGFTSPMNLFSVGRSLAIDIVIGFAQMVVLATGGMNLAVGSIGVCAVMSTGYLLQDVGLPIPIGLAGGLVLGGVLGALNGIAIVRTGVNAFIITLASASLFLGAMLILTKAVPYNALPPELGTFGRLRIGGYISPLLVIAAAIGAALYVLYRHTALGRQILAAGANPRAAAMSGVPVGRVIIFSHVLSGVLAATAGLMLVARLGAAMPAVGGEEWLLPSFIGPVLGGTLLSGGSVAVLGTMFGAALVTTIRSGLLVLQVGNFWLQLFLGVILLLAVMADRYRSVYAERRSLGRR
ncbi:ABC transporter permease [Mesorhizobium sp. BAC0120]|uniref:ABC transporter permease n=1 Tax=Mesorhizobium sp. BAC0120 TaxID=3090670 RepID=UPI00298D161A|nr:ABC transporter permease [Mesorhizobium sp. BAC0120]MDW6024877.1 ABC transporter permease [Mesorhizobium sp. BAC0120]